MKINNLKYKKVYHFRGVFSFLIRNDTTRDELLNTKIFICYYDKNNSFLIDCNDNSIEFILSDTDESFVLQKLIEFEKSIFFIKYFDEKELFLTVYEYDDIEYRGLSFYYKDSSNKLKKFFNNNKYVVILCFDNNKYYLSTIKNTKRIAFKIKYENDILEILEKREINTDKNYIATLYIGNHTIFRDSLSKREYLISKGVSINNYLERCNKDINFNTFKSTKPLRYDSYNIVGENISFNLINDENIDTFSKNISFIDYSYLCISEENIYADIIDSLEYEEIDSSNILDFIIKNLLKLKKHKKVFLFKYEKKIKKTDSKLYVKRNKESRLLPKRGFISYFPLSDYMSHKRRINAFYNILYNKAKMPSLKDILLYKDTYKAFTRPNAIKIDSKRAKLIEDKLSVKLSNSQKQAIEIAINTPDIAIIQGAPGTGKTMLISIILLLLNENVKKANFATNLITAFNHSDIENSISRINNFDLPIFKIENDSKKSNFSKLLDTWRKEKAKELENKHNHIDFNRYVEESNNKEIEDVLISYYDSLKEDNKHYILNSIREYSFIVGATTQHSDSHFIWDYKEDKYYENVLVEEAFRINFLDLLIPLSLSRNRIILLGDNMQLLHHFDKISSKEESKNIKGYNNTFKNLFEHLEELEKRDGIKRTITLTEQYRMHPLLGDFISKHFYNCQLKSPLSKEHFKHNLNTFSNIKDKPYLWIDVSSSLEQNLKRKKEAIIIAKHLKKVLDSNDVDNLTFGVLTFYNEQVNQLKKALRSENILERGSLRVVERYRNNNIFVCSVDSSQGLDFDIVYLSTVRSNYDNRFGFLDFENRLCVSMSRAKRLLIVAGNLKMFQREEAKNKVSALYHFAKLCVEEGCILDEREL